MTSKDSLFSRIKKPLPCFLCKSKVRNHDNFCLKCKNSLKSKSSTPIPNYSKKQSGKVRYFHIKPSNSPETLKQTACFREPESVQPSIMKSCIESSVKDRSIDNIKTLSYTKRPSSSMDFKSIIRPLSKSTKKRKHQMQQNKYFRLTKSPIPELRIQDYSTTYTTFPPFDSYSFHLNTLTDVLVNRGVVYTSSLDYKLQGHNLFNMQLSFDSQAHKKGVTKLCKYQDLLVSVAKDGKLKYWDDECVFQAQAHAGGVYALTSTQDLVMTGNESIKVWQGTALLTEYQNCKTRHLAALDNSHFCSAGPECKLWDLRCWNSASLISSKGPFKCVLPWDEYSVWTASDLEVKVRIT